MTKSPTEIMVLDSQPDSIDFFQKVLGGAGLSVLIETSIDDAIRDVRNHAPHALVINVSASFKDAEKFFAERGRNPALARIPILAAGDLTDEQMQTVKKWGAKDILKRPCDARTALQRVQRLVRDRVSMRYEFPAGELPSVDLRAQGQIVMANEAGFLVDLPIRLATKAPVELQSPLLDNLACSQAVFRRTLLPAKSVTNGFFLNEVAAVGLSPATLGRIREAVRNWK